MILGLDLSLRSTGYAVLDEDKNIIDYGNIQTVSTDDLEIYKVVEDKLTPVLENHIIEDVFIEEMFIRSPKIAMRLGKLHGYILNLLANKKGLDIEYINIMTIKKHITGNGKAGKEDIYNSIIKRYPYLEKELPFAESTAITKGRFKSDDVYDSIGIAICGIEGVK